MLRSDPAAASAAASATPAGEPVAAGPGQDPYRGVIIVLFAAALLGAIAMMAGSLWIGNPVLFDAGITLALSSFILFRAVKMQAARLKPPKDEADASTSSQATKSAAPAEPAKETNAIAAYFGIGFSQSPSRARQPHVMAGIWRWLTGLDEMAWIGLAFAAVGCIFLPLMVWFGGSQIGPFWAGAWATVCLAGAGVAATAARYLRAIDPAGLPEAPGLTQGARVAGWMLMLAAVSMGLEWAGQLTLLRTLHFIAMAVNAALCIGLLTRPGQGRDSGRAVPLDSGVLAALGSRTNLIASVLDAGQRQLGIDLRSTWAFTVIRNSVEPLLIALCLVGWLSTSITVVGLSEQGLVERLGVPVGGQPLMPGLHVHWPWPVDRVFRIPVMRVQALTVGHEAEEKEGPEDVLWARQHAANEYTLLLGNGRDLITVDAAVQFRIADARAWRYRCQNPADALRAIAYRAVMRSTVNRTLSEALSENVVALTGRMREMVQQDADALGLGVEVLAFTVGGMHPPVMVASEYQAVVSAELAKVTAVVNAQAYRNSTVPSAAATALMINNTARAEGEEALARAAGQAWSFRALDSQYRAAPQEFYFRRRLETLENVLRLRGSFMVVDRRFQRDGGELWVMP